jgi:hypothetical protein
MAGSRSKVESKPMAGWRQKVDPKLMAGSILMVGLTTKVGSKQKVESTLMD